MNGANIGWLGAIWDNEYYAHNVFVDNEGIKEKVYLDNGVVLDGIFNESVYTNEIKNNSLNVNANGAEISIMGALLEDGVLFAVTVNHTIAPYISLGNGDWYTYMNIEFHFNSGSTQFLATCNNHIIRNGMSSYCMTVNDGTKYVSTFEIFVPYSSIGVSSDIESIDFTCNGWMETGWCWFFGDNVNWYATHKLTKTGISEL